MEIILATDVCIRKAGIDPKTGVRFLEEISFYDRHGPSSPGSWTTPNHALNAITTIAGFGNIARASDSAAQRTGGRYETSAWSGLNRL